jgi:hypothetical protein
MSATALTLGSRRKAGTTMWICVRILATRCARVLQIIRPNKNEGAVLPQEGSREDRVRAAPAVSRANRKQKAAHEHTGSAEAVRPSLRNGFTAYFVLSLATGFVVTIARVMRSIIANLTPAPGRQDHTTSPSALRAVRQKRIRVHRISSQRS